MELILVPDRVEGVREGKSSSKEEREVLIKWKDLPTHEATWELYSTIQKQFPDFHLEDKVAVWEGSIDKTRGRLTEMITGCPEAGVETRLAFQDKECNQDMDE
ncbi:ty3-gypsy retrotransposon protein [Tanacetum coccineum]